MMLGLQATCYICNHAWHTQWALMCDAHTTVREGDVMQGGCTGVVANARVCMVVWWYMYLSCHICGVLAMDIEATLPMSSPG